MKSSFFSINYPKESVENRRQTLYGFMFWSPWLNSVLLGAKKSINNHDKLAKGDLGWE